MEEKKICKYFLLAVLYIFIYIYKKNCYILVTNCKCEPKKQISEPILSNKSWQQDEHAHEQQRIEDLTKKAPEDNEGKYYYTDDESEFLKDLKVIMKNKKLKKKYRKCQMCICGKEIEKIPPTECRIKVEAFAQHDTEHCLKNRDKNKDTCGDYISLGVLIFPICSDAVLEPEPGVPARKSMKSLWINQEVYFRDPRLEHREFAYPEAVLPPDPVVENKIKECRCESENSSFEMVENTVKK